jgi:hypothetical protein
MTKSKKKGLTEGKGCGSISLAAGETKHEWIGQGLECDAQRLECNGTRAKECERRSPGERLGGTLKTRQGMTATSQEQRP